MFCCWRAEQSLFGIPAVSGHSSCAGEETSAVVGTAGGDLELYALSIMDFLLFSMKNILRKIRKDQERAGCPWLDSRQGQFFLYDVSSPPSLLPCAFTELWGRVAWNPMGSVGSRVPSAPDPSHLPFQGNSDKAERNAFQFASPQVDCKTIKQRCLL